MKYDIRPAKVFLQSNNALKGSGNVHPLRAKIRELLDPTTYKLTYTEYDYRRYISGETFILPGSQQVKYEHDKTRGWHFRQLKGDEMVEYDRPLAKAWFKKYARHKLPPVFRLGPDINNADFPGSSNMAFNYIHATAAELEKANDFIRRRFIFIRHDGREIDSPQYFFTSDNCYYQLREKENRLKQDYYSFAPWSPYNEKVLRDYLKQATA